MITIYPPKHRYKKATPESLYSGVFRNVKLAWPTSRAERYEAFLALRAITNTMPPSTVKLSPQPFTRRTVDNFMSQEWMDLFYGDVQLIHPDLDIYPTICVQYNAGVPNIQQVYGPLNYLAAIFAEIILPGQFRPNASWRWLGIIDYVVGNTTWGSIETIIADEQYRYDDVGVELDIEYQYTHGHIEYGRLSCIHDIDVMNDGLYKVGLMALRYCYAKYFPNIGVEQ